MRVTLSTLVASTLIGVAVVAAIGLAREPAQPASPVPAPAPHAVAMVELDPPTAEQPARAAGPSVLLFEGLGKHSRKALAKPDAQKYFDQGLNFMFAFNHDEAIRAFRQATEIDPDCAMAYWGMAMANFNNAKRFKGFIAEAVKRKDATKLTPKEVRWIDALAMLHAD